MHGFRNTKPQASAAPYGWARVCAPGRAQSATKRQQIRCKGASEIPDDSPPPRMGWEHQFMGKPGTRGHKRMMKRMADLRAKGGMIST